MIGRTGRAALAAALLLGLIAATGKELKTSQSIVVKASAEEVWALLADVGAWSSWCPAVASAAPLKGSGAEEGDKVRFQPIISGKPATRVRFTVKYSQAPNKLVFTGGSGGSRIVFGFTIEAVDQGVKVTSYETLSGPVASIFKKRYGQNALDEEHRIWVGAIKEKLSGR